MDRPDQDTICPFCGEGDFDLWGLKLHLLSGWCAKFEETSEENHG
jgi:hypothetical protein